MTSRGRDADGEEFLADITHRTLEANGIRIHVAEAGEGPLVLLCHGWPESWYSWRHQLTALADAGYRAVAPDMRGYGGSERPEPIEKYTLLHLVGDVAALVPALGGKDAVIVGHDWGARSRGAPHCCGRTSSTRSPALACPSSGGVSASTPR